MKKSSNVIIFVIILMFIVALVALSFAYFSPDVTNIGNIFNRTGSADTSDDFTAYFLENSISLTGTYPMTTVSATNNLDPYMFRVKNESQSKKLNYQIILETKSDNTLKNDLVSTNLGGVLNTGTPATPEDEGYNYAYVIDSGSINANDIKTFNLRIWINENGNNIAGDTNNAENKTWNGKIVIKGSLGDASSPASPRLELLNGSLTKVGSQIAIGTEVFRIISNDGTNIRALAEYNLYVGYINYSDGENKVIPTSDQKYLKQEKTALGDTASRAYPRIATTEYSSTAQHGTLYEDYEGSLLQKYINDYVNYINTTFNSSVTGDAITEAEIYSLCGITDSGNCNATVNGNNRSWVARSSYWSKTSDGGGHLTTIYASGIVGKWERYTTTEAGVRPVIQIPVTAFNS